MKTPEDEAFDDLAKKQGDWGGGFKAKRAMAADRFKDGIQWWMDTKTYGACPNPPQWHIDTGNLVRLVPAQDGKCKLCVDGCAACDARAQPAQEPVALADLVKEAQQIVKSKFLWKKFIDGTPLANDIAFWMADFAQQYTAPPKRERVVFPTMLRKMWSGGEVQAWLDENVNKEKNT